MKKWVLYNVVRRGKDRNNSDMSILYTKKPSEKELLPGQLLPILSESKWVKFINIGNIFGLLCFFLVKLLSFENKLVM